MFIPKPSLALPAKYTITIINESLGGNCTEATAISDEGKLVGNSTLGTSGYPSHAFLWENGNITDLGTLDGEHSGASAINDFGQIVGYSELSYGAESYSPKYRRAFLWEKAKGTMRDLGTLGGGNSQAFGINNLGQVVGASDLIDGSYRAFLGEWHYD